MTQRLLCHSAINCGAMYGLDAGKLSREAAGRGEERLPTLASSVALLIATPPARSSGCEERPGVCAEQPAVAVLWLFELAGLFAFRADAWRPDGIRKRVKQALRPGLLASAGEVRGRTRGKKKKPWRVSEWQRGAEDVDCDGPLAGQTPVREDASGEGVAPGRRAEGGE